MKRNIVFSLALTALLALSSCSIVALGPEETGDEPVSEETRIALAVMQTQTAAGLEAQPAEAATITVGGGVTPVSSVPMVSVSTATNCRTGPGEPYEIVGALAVGEHAEVIGRNQSGDTWIIRLPSNPSVTCWLWGYYATVEGDTAGLTVYTPPPTPTPSAGFTVAYSYMVTCPGGLYAFRFLFTNTGSVTYKSYQVDVTDAVTAESRSYSSNLFVDGTPLCVAIPPGLMDLTPGESGGAGSWAAGRLSADPTGHSITISFRLCTEDGLGGECDVRAITFTP